MVGGEVIETIICADAVYINCTGKEGERGQECAVYVEDTPAAQCISEGDTVWWQSSYVFWTPKRPQDKKVIQDYNLKRIGYSGVPRPSDEEIICGIKEKV